MLAQGAGKIVGQLFSFVLVSADSADPDRLADGPFAGRFRFRLNIVQVVIIRRGGRVVENVHIDDFRNKEGVGSEVDLAYDFRGNIGVGPFRNGERSVGRAFDAREIGEFIDVPARLKAKPLKERKIGAFADNRRGKPFRFRDEVVRVVELIDRDGNLVRFRRNLPDRIDDTAAVPAVFLGRRTRCTLLFWSRWDPFVAIWRVRGEERNFKSAPPTARGPSAGLNSRA